MRTCKVYHAPARFPSQMGRCGHKHSVFDDDAEPCGERVAQRADSLGRSRASNSAAVWPVSQDYRRSLRHLVSNIGHERRMLTLSPLKDRKAPSGRKSSPLCAFRGARSFVTAAGLEALEVEPGTGQAVKAPQRPGAGHRLTTSDRARCARGHGPRQPQQVTQRPCGANRAKEPSRQPWSPCCGDRKAPRSPRPSRPGAGSRAPSAVLAGALKKRFGLVAAHSGWAPTGRTLRRAPEHPQPSGGCAGTPTSTEPRVRASLDLAGTATSGRCLGWRPGTPRRRTASSRRSGRGR